jgi:hypothetical protein
MRGAHHCSPDLLHLIAETVMGNHKIMEHEINHVRQAPQPASTPHRMWRANFGADHTSPRSFWVWLVEHSHQHFLSPFSGSSRARECSRGSGSVPLRSAAARSRDGFFRMTALDRQRVYCAAMAQPEIRGYLSQGLRRRPRGQSRDRQKARLFTITGVRTRRWPTGHRWRSGAPAPTARFGERLWI